MTTLTGLFLKLQLRTLMCSWTLYHHTLVFVRSYSTYVCPLNKKFNNATAKEEAYRSGDWILYTLARKKLTKEIRVAERNYCEKQGGKALITLPKIRDFPPSLEITDCLKT